jgi:hypothetical protein
VVEDGGLVVGIRPTPDPGSGVEVELAQCLRTRALGSDLHGHEWPVPSPLRDDGDDSAAALAHFFPAFFFPATVFFGPLRVRALVLVR